MAITLSPSPRAQPTPGSPPTADRRWRIAPPAIVLLAFLLRAGGIGAFSASGDEINSLFFATRPLGDLIDRLATNEPHPPAYYALLKLWLPAVGDTELALRWPSVLAGTLAVAALIAAGRTISGPGAGIGAGALGALSQFAILHAQDARMYALLLALAAIFLAGLVRLIDRGDRTAAGLTIAAGSGAALTHYHGLLLVAVGGALFALTVPARAWWPRLLVWPAIGLGLLPWALIARDIFLRYRGWMAVVPPAEVVSRAGVAYSLGEGVAGALAGPALVVLPVVAGLGAIALIGRRQIRELVVLGGSIGLPFAVVIAGGWAGRPLFHERYLIVVLPAYLVLAGVGLAALSRRRAGRAIAAGGVALVAFAALPGYYRPAAPEKPDFRAAVAWFEARAAPDAALVMPEPQGPIVDYYLRGRRASYVSRPGESAARVAADLDRVLAGRSEVWFLRYSAGDWDDPIGRWLNDRAFYRDDTWVSKIRLERHVLIDPANLIPAERRAAISDGPGLAAETVGPRRAWPGRVAVAGFAWTGDRGPDPALQVSLRLIDPFGQTVGLLDRPADNPAGLADPGSGRAWRGAIAIPDDAAPGRYRVEARFYDGPSGRPRGVQVDGRVAEALAIGTIEVAPRPAAELPASAPAPDGALAVTPGLFAGDLRLGGAPYSPDGRVIIDLVWHATAPAVPVAPEFAVLAANGDAIARQPSAIDQTYPLAGLRPGERVRDQVGLSPRGIRQAGRYQVAVRAAEGAPWQRIDTIEVGVDPSRYQRPDLAQARADRFGDAIVLIGATAPDAVEAGREFSVDLAWLADRPPDRHNTVFVHLIDAAGRPIAQSDAPPAGGTRPTGDWIAGEIVRDRQTLSVPAELAPGEYEVIVGLYDSATGRRLPIAGGGETARLARVRVAAPGGPGR